MTNLFKNKNFKTIFIICVSVIVLVATSLTIYFVFFNDNDADNAGQYQITELSEGKKIPDNRDFAIVDEDGNTIVNKHDVTIVYVSYEKSKDRYLELRLTESAAQKFKEALEDDELSIMLNGKKLTSPVVADDIEENSAIVCGKYEDVMEWYNAITLN